MAYTHPDDPNLKNLHKAMEYNSSTGEPRIRVNAEGVTIAGDVNVDSVTVNNTEANPVPVDITNAEFQISNDVSSPIPVIGTTINPWGKAVLQVDDDTVQHTSKNRRKISSYEILNFNTFQHGDDTEIWESVSVGTASSNYDEYMGMMRMDVGSSAGDTVSRQTRRVIRYVPGRANEISMAVLFTTPTIGVRRRFGVYDDYNGAYFEDGGDGTYYCVIRHNTESGVVEHRVARNDWNRDKLDGTGPSGIAADPTKIQLMVIEYEWYGAGHVEFKFVIGNNAIPVHQFDHANTIDHAWCNTPFVPVRAEITNVAGAPGTHSFYVGSTSVLAEGTIGPLGIEYNASSPITGKTTPNTANTFIPIVSIRMQSDKLDSCIIPLDFQAATLDNTGLFYRIALNPVLTDADWNPVGNGSYCDFDIAATAQSNGKILKTGYISPNSQGATINFTDKVLNQLGRKNSGTVSDIYTIEIATVNGNKDAFASLNWIEVR